MKSAHQLLNVSQKEYLKMIKLICSGNGFWLQTENTSSISVTWPADTKQMMNSLS